ncbi:SDR family oxidoreductase [Beijerinckia sp. L45]|uniref:SDR family NAD(P)-dependent oxidoreductase n=1 Tax=Beijerinckia sp. L45 TaxID=1641855 RepID=UPI00131B728D|nr:SDR family NAD(P)-dependent oxidoreductase [Beijerinckia sp. L45]
MTHPVLVSRNVAVITGGASGIGLAAAKAFLKLGLRVAIADLPGEKLAAAEQELGALGVALAVPTDVSLKESLAHLEKVVLDQLGPINVLMNNAAISPSTDVFGPAEAWSAMLGTNLLGVIHGTQIIGPGMVASGKPGLIINTGSKQGITMPPGNPAYNIAKAGIKAFTEALQHQLRNTDGCKIAAHLLIPGFVYTGLTARGRAEKPAAAWTAEQTVDFMLESLDRGDFYILCPDNDVPRAVDERRILWAAGDIVENRPPLSRWHADHAAAFAAFAATED